MSTNSRTDSMVLIWSENLGISYAVGDKKTAAVRNTDLRILRGEYVAVKGLYGPARNSFLNLISCLEKPEEGKYVFDYNDISHLTHKELVEMRKTRIGFLFPGYNLFEDYSVRQNIEFPLNYMNISQKDKQKLALRALEKVDLAEYAEKSIGSLTELQKNKLCLARAIVHDPLLLIACEPVSTVNRTEASGFMEILDSLNGEGLSILLVTDREHIAQKAGRTIVFEDGLVVSDEYAGESGFGREDCAACTE